MNPSNHSKLLGSCPPLNDLIATILKASPNVHYMRDATRGGLGAIMAETAKSAKVRIDISEHIIPVQKNFRSICEILGLDQLFLANEGNMILFCPSSDAQIVLTAMKDHKYGQNAAIIGTVGDICKGRVVLKTIIGGERIVDLPTGELVPRIC
jgi:hydrogenase expression/formation protein HypE